MKYKIGDKVKITHKNTPYFDDEGKIGTLVGISAKHNNYYYIYISGSKNNRGQHTEEGNKYTWSMAKIQFIRCKQEEEQLLFSFMYDN